MVVVLVLFVLFVVFWLFLCCFSFYLCFVLFITYCCIWWFLPRIVITFLGKRDLLALLSLVCNICTVCYDLFALPLGRLRSLIMTLL